MTFMQPFGGNVVGAETWLAWGAPFLLLITLWSIVWKGLALWHSAKRGDSWWFIALLVINTAGLLEIFYLFVIAKKKFSELLGSGNQTP